MARFSRVSLKVLAEKGENPDARLLEEISRDPGFFLMPLRFGIQFLQVATAVVVAYLFFSSRLPYALVGALVTMVVVVSVFRQLIPKIWTQRDPEGILLKLLPFFTKCYGVLRWLTSPQMTVLRLAQSLRTKNHRLILRDEESTEEEIQAYIGVGEEEGLFEGEESELIQSALEFGNTIVKEIMIPRSEIVATEQGATVSAVRNLMVSSKHSRIPIYRERIDQIVGVVYVRNLLSYLQEGRGDDPVVRLMKEPWFVPHTKKVSGLLKEMQAEAKHLAIVINEFGAISGLVTMEDLIEEIVGEIRDEDEAQKIDLAYEGEGNYIVRGGVEIDNLEEVLDLNLGEWDVSTVSGLVVTYLGRVPTPGETFFINGMEVEVLSADRKKIHTMRIQKLQEPLQE